MRIKKRIQNYKNEIIWPLIYPVLLVITLVFNLILPSYAQGSGYYDVPDIGRPRSAFSLCCCKKGNETANEIFYSCNYVEAVTCPEDSKQYKVSLTECPSNLMFTKYVQKEE